MIQRPAPTAEVAIVMRGLKGTGKGMLGKWLLRLYGQHRTLHRQRRTSHWTVQRDICGTRSLIFADEAFFAGDKQHEGVLKAIITETSLLIEAKYRTPVMASNMLHLLMASNATWVIPASHDERRYLMLDVAADRKGDAGYFRRLDRQMVRGGLAAMLHGTLLHLELGDFHPRMVPGDGQLYRTEAPLARLAASLVDRGPRPCGFVWRLRYGHRDFLNWDTFVSTELLNQVLPAVVHRQPSCSSRAPRDTRPVHDEVLSPTQAARRLGRL